MRKSRIMEVGVLIASIIMMGGAAFAVDIDGDPQILPIQGQAVMGATHVIEIDASSFTETTTNTAQQVTIPIAAKMGVELVCMQLPTAFVGADYTNGTPSCVVTVGDDGAVARFMASTELASANTEVFLSYGTGTQLGYTSADEIDFTFTSDADNNLADLVSGKIKFYLKIIDAR